MGIIPIMTRAPAAPEVLERLFASGHSSAGLEDLLSLSRGYLSKVRHGRARPSKQLLALLVLLESHPSSTAAALRGVAGPARREPAPAVSSPPGGVALPTLLGLVPELERRRVPWAIGGAVALEAYGVPRETHDVDIFVDDAHREVLGVLKGAGLALAHFQDELVAAFPRGGGGGDRIDVIFPGSEPARSALHEPERRYLRGVDVPVLPAVALAAMKLMSARPKEHADALRLFDAGIASRKAVRSVLRRLTSAPPSSDPWASRLFDPARGLARLESSR
jgi:hypothetical protein